MTFKDFMFRAPFFDWFNKLFNAPVTPDITIGELIVVLIVIQLIGAFLLWVWRS